MLLINKLNYMSYSNNDNNDNNYYSISILDINNKNQIGHEIISLNNGYLYSLNSFPILNKNDKQSKVFKNINNAIKLLFKITENKNEFELIIRTLINQKGINIYLIKNNRLCELKNINEFNLNLKYLICSNNIDMSLFYEIIYSCNNYDKYIMFNKNDIIHDKQNNLMKIIKIKNNYSINDYKNIGKEYTKICDTYIEDLRHELYINS